MSAWSAIFLAAELVWCFQTGDRSCRRIFHSLSNPKSVGVVAGLFGDLLIGLGCGLSPVANRRYKKDYRSFSIGISVETEGGAT